MRSPRSRRLFRLPWRTDRQIGADVDEELRFHIDTRVDDLIRAGMPPDSAREQAAREFGDVEDARRYCTTVDRHTEAATRRNEIMIDSITDLRYALRKLRTAPAFTITAILTLALGIGANTAIFSVVNSVVLRPLPFDDADNLVRLKYTENGQGDSGSPPDLADYRSRAQSFEGFAMMEGAPFNLVRTGEQPERLTGVRVSANWFALLRTKPLVGRSFVEGEDEEGAPKVAILSEALWRDRFDGDTTVVGRPIRLNAEPVTVIGVMPTASQYPLTVQIWTPLVFSARDKSDQARGAHWLTMLARLEPGVTIEAATAEMSKVTSEVNRAFPDVYNNRMATPVRLQDFIIGDIRRPLWVVMGAVGFVLLIACANVANLLLVRATSRESELAIRSALGAGEGRLMRQLVTESLVLSLTGAAAGLAIAHFGMRALVSLAPPAIPQLASVKIDGLTLGVTATIAILTGLIFGILPGRGIARGSAIALRTGARGARTRPGTVRLRRSIVIAEVAMAVTLLSGAGLLIRSFDRLLRVEPGFDPERVTTYNATLPGQGYTNPDAVRAFVARLETGLQAIPGVTNASVSTDLPLDGRNFVISFVIHGKPAPPPNAGPAARIVGITPDYFNTTGMKLDVGRHFTGEDRKGAPLVAVVNKEFVRRHLPNEDPLGKYIELGWTGGEAQRRGGTIVGVVGDVKQSSLDSEVEPTIYLPFAQAPRSGLAVAVRTAGAETSVATALRAQLRELDAELPMYNLRQMKEIVARSVATDRFYTVLLSAFAVVALLLAAVGLYGVIAYAVGQRTHELGVRVALGATADRITRMVIAEGVAMAVAGVAIGLVAASLLTRVLTSLLFGVRPGDPLTFVSVAVALVVVAVSASYIPARRASRADPLVAIRGD